MRISLTKALVLWWCDNKSVLIWFDLKRRTKYLSSTLRSRQAACLDQLWRALRNSSRRLRSHLKRCDTSSKNAPSLLLLPVALYLCRLSSQLSQRQPLLSPDLIKFGRIEGVHAHQDATPSRSTMEPGPRSPIRRLRSPPNQPGRKKEEGSESHYHRTTPQEVSNVRLVTTLSAGCKRKCVIGSPQAHFSAWASNRCDSGQNKTHIFSKREQISSSA